MDLWMNFPAGATTRSFSRGSRVLLPFALSCLALGGSPQAQAFLDVPHSKGRPLPDGTAGLQLPESRSPLGTLSLPAPSSGDGEFRSRGSASALPKLSISRVRALERLDPEGQLSVPLLGWLAASLAASDGDSEEAAWALARCRSNGTRAARALLEARRTTGRRFWWQLAHLLPVARESAPQVLEALTGENPARSPELIALGRRAGTLPAGLAVSLLGPMPDMDSWRPEDGDPVTRFASLSALGSEGARLVPALVERLRNENGQAGTLTLRMLAALGPAGASAKFPLVEQLSLQPEDPFWVDRVIATLDAVRSPRPESPADLLATLQGDRASPGAGYAAYALGRLSDRAAIPATVSALGRVAKEGPPLLRFVAIRSLGVLGPDAAPVVPLLCDAMRTRRPPVTRSAVRTEESVSERWDRCLLDAVTEALGRIGPAARDAIPLLEAAHGGHEDDRSYDLLVQIAVCRIAGRSGRGLSVRFDPSIAVPVSWGCALGSGAACQPVPPPRPEREPDGSWGVPMDIRDGLGGTTLRVFLDRDAAGRPRAWASVDGCGCGRCWREDATSGWIVLNTSNLLTDTPLIGEFAIGTPSNPLAYRGGFTIENPFAP